MSKEFMGDMLYNKFIFTIPIIWDICITYGVDNPRHVSKLMESVFTIQPRYESDTVAAVAFVQEVRGAYIVCMNKVIKTRCYCVILIKINILLC